MVRIISDSSTLYSTAQARKTGFAVSPLSVTIAGKSYRGEAVIAGFSPSPRPFPIPSCEKWEIML